MVNAWLAEVGWTDAHFEIDSPGDWSEEYLCRTIGFVIMETERWIRLAQEMLPDGEPRAITSIPKSAVEYVLPLEATSHPSVQTSEPEMPSRRRC